MKVPTNPATLIGKYADEELSVTYGMFSMHTVTLNNIVI